MVKIRLKQNGTLDTVVCEGFKRRQQHTERVIIGDGRFEGLASRLRIEERVYDVFDMNTDPVENRRKILGGLCALCSGLPVRMFETSNPPWTSNTTRMSIQ